MTFSQKLELLMNGSALSNLELGKKLGGISHTTVADWRNGARPRRKAALRLAEYFGVPVDFLLNDKQDFSPEFLAAHAEASVAISGAAHNFEESVQFTVITGLILPRLSAKQIAEIARDVIANKALAERSKIFWLRLLSPWLVTKLDSEEVAALPPPQRIAKRRSQNDQKRAHPKAKEGAA